MASMIHTPTFSNALVLATPTGILFGQIRELQNIQIRTVSSMLHPCPFFVLMFLPQIPFGLENPKKFAHHAGIGVFGVGCTRTVRLTPALSDSFTSTFKILDESTFEGQ